MSSRKTFNTEELYMIWHNGNSTFMVYSDPSEAVKKAEILNSEYGGNKFRAMPLKIDQLGYEWSEEASAKLYTENDMLMHKAEAIRYEREQNSNRAAAAVMKFKSKVGGKYYPGYHEDMRDYVKKEVRRDR